MVAALSIVVIGLVNITRKETQRTTQSRQAVQAVALADAALHLAMQEIKVKPALGMKRSTISTQYEGVAMQVDVQPLNGLIDLNYATPELLTALLSIAGGLDQSEAQAMALAMLEIRSKRDARGVQVGFETIEDLLAVPGFDYSLYVRVRGLVTADVRSAGRINPAAASAEVLTILTQGDVQRAEQIAAGLLSGAVGVDLTSLNPGFVDSSTSMLMRLVTFAPLSDGGKVFASRSVNLASNPREGIAWRTFRSAHWFESAAQSPR
jgi:general secretion pathway protein K